MAPRGLKYQLEIVCFEIETLESSVRKWLLNMLNIVVGHWKPQTINPELVRRQSSGSTGEGVRRHAMAFRTPVRTTLHTPLHTLGKAMAHGHVDLESVDHPPRRAATRGETRSSAPRSAPKPSKKLSDRCLLVEQVKAGAIATWNAQSPVKAALPFSAPAKWSLRPADTRSFSCQEFWQTCFYVCSSECMFPWLGTQKARCPLSRCRPLRPKAITSPASLQVSPKSPTALTVPLRPHCESPKIPPSHPKLTPPKAKGKETRKAVKAGDRIVSVNGFKGTSSFLLQATRLVW